MGLDCRGPAVSECIGANSTPYCYKRMHATRARQIHDPAGVCTAQDPCSTQKEAYNQITFAFINPRPVTAFQVRYESPTTLSLPTQIHFSCCLSPYLPPPNTSYPSLHTIYSPSSLAPSSLQTTHTHASMSLTTIPTTTFYKPLSAKPKSSSPSISPPKFKPLTIRASSDQESSSSSLKAFSAALALSSILLSSAPFPAAADISGLTPCKESKAFAKREKQSIKKLEASLKKYPEDSAPALAIQATIDKTKRRFEFYGNAGLLCGSDGLPHLIVSGDQRHWGEFITPGILFLYIAGYLIAIRDDKKPTQKEIIIDVPLASRLLFRGFIWPVAAYRELVNGDLIVKDV
ncbi:hypothetical protein ACLOJK_020001 [Asimina triloba]